MRCPLRVPSAVLVAAATLLAGCGQKQTPPAGAASSPQPGSKSGKYDVTLASAEGKLARDGQADGEPGSLPAKDLWLPLDEVAAEDLTMPKVLLSQAHAQSCRVQVGDPFPGFELADLDGHAQSFGKLAGRELTVVFFWNGRQPTALEELTDLGPQVAGRFAKDPVAVIGINTGDSPQLASELAKQAAAKFVNLSDADGRAFAQVASGKIPRTYLVDASGTIVWFDVEYSRTTRRDLRQAIRYLLAHKAP